MIPLSHDENVSAERLRSVTLNVRGFINSEQKRAGRKWSLSILPIITASALRNISK
jgi:hypothetical protein